MKQRSRGLTTGSHSAGLLSRPPVEQVAKDRCHVWRQYGFSLGPHGKLAFANWADNVFSVAHDPGSAAFILEDFALQMDQRWGLQMGVESKEVLILNGGSGLPDDAARAGWRAVKDMKVLGMMLCGDGSSTLCFENTIRSMWRAFYANIRHSGLRRSKVAIKQQLVKRAVTPNFTYRCARWSWSSTRAKRLDGVQNAMLAKCIVVPPMPFEDRLGYKIRKSTLASDLNRHCRWSAEWRTRLQTWHDHVRRHRNSWVSRLLSYHDAAWIRDQRRLHGSSASGSRTRTRAQSGRVANRWQESLPFL